MAFAFKVIAYGLGAILAAIGGILLIQGYDRDPMNGQEINAGWILIIASIMMWLIGVSLKQYNRHHPPRRRRR